MYHSKDLMRRRSPWLAAALLVASLGLALHATAPPPAQERLRRLVRLPDLAPPLGLAFDPLHGFDNLSERAEALHEIDEAQKALRGDSSDAPRYLRLGRLYAEAGNGAQARFALNQAVALYRKQGADQSSDGGVLAGFGEALAAARQNEEAERVLRQAVKIDPKDWRCRNALGHLLLSLAWSSVDPGAAGPASAAPRGLDPSLGARLSPDQAERAQKLIRESLACYNQAQRLAPDEPEVYAGRAACEAADSSFRTLMLAAAGQALDPTQLWNSTFPSDALADFQSAAQHRPQDWRALGTAALFEVCHASNETGLEGPEARLQPGAWNTLTDHTRRSLRDTMTHLEEVAHAADAHAAAGALEVLGMLQYLVVHDTPGAEASLRQAVSLDPRRDQAWELLATILEQTQRPQALLDISQARLKVLDNAHNRLLAARALEALHRPAAMLEAVATAQRLYPADFTTNLALAAALLEANTDPFSTARAMVYLARAEQLLGSAPPRDRLLNLLLVRGLFFGLAGQPEAARSNLQQLLELDKNNTVAQDALDALE